MFKNLRMAKDANRLRKEFEQLWDAVPPSAYRPTVKFEDKPPAMVAVVALDRLASMGRQYGATAGDVNILAVEVLREIDRLQSYGHGFDSVTARVKSGEICTVSRMPMRNHLAPDAVTRVLELAASAGRIEAYAEYISKGGTAHI